MINLDISRNQTRNQRQNNENDTLDEALASIAAGTFDENKNEDEEKNTQHDLDYYLANPKNIPTEDLQPQPPQNGDVKPGNLSGTLRGVANYTAAGVDYGGQLVLNNATLWGTEIAGVANATPEVTIFGENGMFEFTGRDKERPLKNTPHGWLPPEAQQEIARKYWHAPIAEVPAWLGSQWKSGMNAVDEWINGSEKTTIDQITHGAGTGHGFGGASAAIRAGIDKLIDGLPAFSPKVKVLKFIADTLEAGTEAGGFIVDRYSEDPTVLNNPEKLINMAKLSGMNFAANALPDYLLDFAGDFIGGKLPVKGLVPKIAKGMLGEAVKENIQEAYQTATGNATLKTFNSGNISLGNFLTNLKDEYRKIAPYTDEKGNEHSGYFLEQLPQVTASTLLSTGVMTAMGWPSPKQRGHIFTQKGREQMQSYSDYIDHLQDMKDPKKRQEWLEQTYTGLKTERDNLGRQLDDLNTQRDNLQAEINNAYGLLSSGSTSDGGMSMEIDRAAYFAKIADMEAQLKETEQKIRTAEQEINKKDAQIASFWGSQSDVISNPVQDDAMSLFPDADEINQTTDNPVPDTENTQYAPATAQPETTSAPVVNILGKNANTDGDNTENIQDDEPDLIADVRNDDMLLGYNRNAQNNTQPDNIPEDFVDDEPDVDLEDYGGEHYNQTDSSIAVTSGHSLDNGDRDAGQFVFGTKSKDYTFNVAATSWHSSSPTDRLTRYRGQYLELRNKRGKVIATYYPYSGQFSFSSEADRKHSRQWKQSFQSSFMNNVNTYLQNGGFLDEEGNLRPDGNEGFRRRWDKRLKEPDAANAFYSDEAQPEDFDTPEAGKISISYENGEGKLVKRDFSVVPGEFDDTMPEQKKYFGRYLAVNDSYGRTVARYSPYTRTLRFAKSEDTEYIRKPVTEQLRRRGKTFLRNAGFLDQNGALIPDGNEDYRAQKKAQGANNTNPEIQPQGTQSITPLGQQNNTPTPNSQETITPRQQENTVPNQQKAKGRKAQLADAISNAGSRIDTGLGNETYNQQADSNESQQSLIGSAVNFVTGLLGINSNTDTNADTQGTQNNNSNTQTIKVTSADGKEHTLTARRKSFDGKHLQAKQYHGDYIEFTDENGRIVARWSPYSGQFQLTDVQDADILQPQIVRSLNNNMNNYLRDFGYLDKYDRLIPDGNEKFRHKYKARQDTTPEGKTAHPDNTNTKQGKKRKDTRSWRQRWDDAREEKKKTEQVRRNVEKTIYSELRKFLQSGVTPRYAGQELENIIKEIEGETPRARRKRIHRYMAQLARNYSHNITARIAAAAHLAGMSVEDYHKLWKLRIQLDIDPNTNTRGYVVFQPARTEKDKNGKEIFHEAETIIHVTQLHNESTILHEFAHIFFRDYQDLIASVDDLPAKVKKDWAYLSKWLGISDIDPKSTKQTRTEEEDRRWNNAQEKFAVAFEQYYMTGKAPTSRLQRVFNYFKQWLSHVYGAIKNITYAGSDGRMHEVELSPEVKRIFDRMLKDVPYVPSSESSKARFERTNNPQQGEEYHKQTADAQEDSINENEERELNRLRLNLNLPFNPNDLRTETGRTIDEARSNELLINPEGSTALAYIDAAIAKNAGIQEGEIQANVGVLRHAEQRHGKQIRNAGYDNVQTFLLDTLNNWQEIRQGTDNSIWLVAPKYDGHGAVAALRLQQDRNGIYRVATLVFARNRAIKNKKLLFAGRPSPTPSSGSGMNLARAESDFSSEVSAAKGGLSKEHSLLQSLSPDTPSVNSSNTEPTRIGRSNNTFVTPKDIERYEQLATHATGHIILSNKFDLRYVGSGEGYQAFGYGIYFAQNQDVAEYYRRMGLKQKDLFQDSITTTDGKTFYYNPDNSAWETKDGVPATQYVMSLLLHDIRVEMLDNDYTDIEQAKKSLYDGYVFERNKAAYIGNDEDYARYQDLIDCLDSVSSFKHEQLRNGNIYFADIPQNDVLIDWDESLAGQSEKVQKSISKVIARLEQWHIDSEHLKHSKDGGDFYSRLKQALEPLVKKGKVKAAKYGIISRPDMAASLILNQFGIPGLRYWDGESRDQKTGTHNFVIWNTDMIKLLGLSGDSDEDANHYFREQAKEKRKQKSETYQQIIGIDGAKRLDDAEGATLRMDNLKLARTMERKGLNAKKLWLATGWQRGKDNKWRYELPDGKLIDKNIRKLHRLYSWLIGIQRKSKQISGYSLTPSEEKRYNFIENFDNSLHNLFDAPELFTAYPDLRNVKVYFDDLDEDNDAMYNPTADSITLNYNIKSAQEIRKSLIHEIQHAIQEREGFAAGSNISLDDDRQFRKAKDILERITGTLDEHSAQRVKDALNEEFFGSSIRAIFMAVSLSKDEYSVYEKALLPASIMKERRDFLFDKYKRSAGETEARNTETRSQWSERKKLKTPLDASEDVARDRQIVGRMLRKAQSANETYSQIIGQKGAQQLDKKNGNSWLIDNLNMAQKMREKGFKPKTIRRATGWELGTDNEWKYELQDGNIDVPALWDAFQNNNETLPFSITLGNLYNNSDLFNAYPELVNLPVEFTADLPDNILGLCVRDFFDENKKLIQINTVSGINEFQSILIHEIQHAVQFIEGFAEGGTNRDILIQGSVAMSIADRQKNALLAIATDNVRKAADLYQKGLTTRAEKLIQSFSRKEQFKWRRIKPILESIRNGQFRLYNSYPYLGGEIEARNSQARAHFSPEQRRNTPLSQTQDINDWLITKNGINQNFGIVQQFSNNYRNEHPETYSQQGRELNTETTETYYQIGSRRKHDMDTALAKSRPDMTPEQRADAINEIEKLGETVRRGGNPKVEKIATHWLLGGHIILPEDNYKILDAIKISEQQHFDPMSFDDPNEILAKYTIKETKAEKRINPDTIPEFSHKVEYPSGITVYTVADSKKGQKAVRAIIDTHWGKDANPWCLAARNEHGNLTNAWEYWKEYNTVPKRTAFQNGKLLAFCASDDDTNTWWDREDKPHKGIPYTVKENRNTFVYSYNEENGHSVKIKENLADGTIHEWSENGTLWTEILPDGTKRKFFRNGQILSEELPDGTLYSWYENGRKASEELPNGVNRTWDTNGSMSSEKLPDGTEHIWHENGQLSYEHLPDGTVHEWYENGKKEYEKLPDRTEREWYENGRMSSETLPDGTERSWYWNGQLAREVLPDRTTNNNTTRSWDKNGNLISESLPDGTERTFHENGQLESEKLPDGTIQGWDKDGNLRSQENPDGTQRMFYPDGQLLIETLPDGTKRTWRKNGQLETEIFPDKTERYYYKDGSITERLPNGTIRKYSPNGEETYSQSVNDNNSDTERSAESFLTPEAKKQVDALRAKYQHTPQWLKAPNGKDTNLNETQWLLVRTDNFKNWFGDWENDKENSSKVLDKNGEPLVVTHISRGEGGFSVFDTDGNFSLDGDKTLGTGAWFADLKGNEAKSLATAGIYNAAEGENIYHVFLNIRNPYIHDAQGKRWQRVGSVWIEDTETGEIISTNYDKKVFSNLSWAQGFIDKHLDPYGDEPDRYVVRHSDFQTSDDLVRFVREGRIGDGSHDGVIIKNLRDMSVWGVDDYIIFNSNQVKSATRNNGMFSTTNDEIYKQTAQETQETTSLLKKYSDILKNTNIDDINPDNLLKGTKGFTTPDIIEKYNQQNVTHATGHIILNNRLSMNYLLSGEGTNFQGAGIYLEQNPKVAEYYRRFGIPNLGKGTLHVHLIDGKTFSTADTDSWDNSPDDIMRKALNLVQKAAMSDYTFEDLKKIANNHLVSAIYTHGTNSKEARDAREVLKALDKISHWDFTPDENSHRNGNIYNVQIPDNDILLNWDALLDEQPKHVKKAMDKINAFIERLVDDYELDTEAAWEAANSDLENSGGQFYNFVSNIMEQYLENNTPDDGITDPQLRTSLLFLKFGIPGHRYWDGFSRDAIYDKYKEYRKNNPLSNGRKAFSVAVTADGQEYSTRTPNGDWNNNPNDILKEVLTDIKYLFEPRYSFEQHFFTPAASFKEAKETMLRNYQSKIKERTEYYSHKKKSNEEYAWYSPEEAQERLQNEIKHIQDKIAALNSITAFTYNPEIKAEPYSPFAKFGNEGTRNFVIWDENMLYIIGLTPDSDKDAIDYFNNYKAEHPDSFITPEQLEQYNQLVYHGTDNTIFGNRFKLRFLGSSEGSANYGYGAYFAENLKVAQEYRHYGDEHKGDSRISITTKDGKTYQSLGPDRWNIGVNAYWSSVLADLRSLAIHSNTHDIDQLKKDILTSYRQELKEHRSVLSELKRELKNNPRNDTQDRINLRSDYINNVKEKIKALNSVTDITVLPPKNGNIYSFDIPENDMLLDWNKSMGRQPEIIKKARREILQEIKYWGLDNSEAKKAKTGEEFYRALTNLFRHSWDYNFAYPQSGITDPQQRASLILNMHGVPGLRYWDSGSRDKKRGTHNFVIWNNDAIKMLGIMPDSNHEAIDYFNKYKAEHSTGNDNETYNQIIGEQGARNLDEAENSNDRMNNLRIAQQMERKGIPPKKIWLTTGWEKAHDGKWRYEIQDRRVNLELIADIASEHLKYKGQFFGLNLNDVYDNPELFTAYPEIAKFRVSFYFDPDGESGFYRAGEDRICVNTAYGLNDLRSTVIHELQHAIQYIEGFTRGGNPELIETDLDKYATRKEAIQNKINKLDAKSGANAFIEKLREKIYSGGFDKHQSLSEMLNRFRFASPYGKQYKTLLQELKKLRDEFVEKYHGYVKPIDIYTHLGGEIEARNAAARADLTLQQRRENILADTQDTSDWIVHDNNGNYSSNPDIYSQTADTAHSVDDFLTPEARQQVNSLRANLQGTPKWLKAPNGKDTNLNELQWLLVRTPNFKRWFGDWENDPDNASKILDENGEPLVVFHGSSHGEFDMFDTIGKYGSDTYETGSWFTTSYEAAMFYAGGQEERIYDIFLNVRTPYIYNADGKKWCNLSLFKIYDYVSDNELTYKQDGSPFYSYDEAMDYLRNVMHAEQEKDNYGNSRYEILHDVNVETNEIVKAVWDGKLGNEEYDGVIFKDVIDPYHVMDDYIVRIPNNIKSATRNNGEYSLDNDEIYKQSAQGLEYGNSLRYDISVLTPEAKKQIAIVRDKYKGTSNWLKAPNSQKSNLNELQWLLVRTPNFKNWFGDWENDPQNASKVIDENGEPLVLYHRTERGNNFSVFRENSGGIHFGTRRQADDRAKGKLFAVFLNVRNPDRTFDQRTSWNYYVEWTKNAGYDGIVYPNEVEGVEPGTAPQDSWIVFTPNQIKSATRNNGEYSLSNDEIYKQSAATDTTESDNAIRSQDDFLTPEVKARINAIRKQYQGTKQWLKAPNGKASNLNELQWLLVRTDNFKHWFGDWEHDPQNASKVLDSNGEPLIVYHGTGRADRVGSIFRKDRATSGPMAFFTDSRQIAEGYSKSKSDTSLSRDGLNEYKNRFVIEKKGRNGKSTFTTLLDYWYSLPASKQAQIAAIAPTITEDYENYDDEKGKTFISKPGNKVGAGAYVEHLREARGNHLAALFEEWLYSGNLFNEEEKFLDILHLVGLDNVTYRDPYYREEAVYPVFLNLRNPLDTSNITESDIKALRRSAIAAERHYNPQNAYDADSWDKSSISPMAWLERLQEDIDNGTTYSWTQIPDFVTNRLKKLGYDGIKDTGGKYNSDSHTVYVPFASTQIKSSERNNGEYSSNPDIYKQSAQGLEYGNSLRYDVSMLTPEAKRQIAIVRDRYKGTSKWLKAPNGKRTKLTQLQWLLVRTPNFKQWFGDWENDKEHASKILDKNGEPLVVFHQTNRKRYVHKDTGQDWDNLSWEEKDTWEKRDDWDNFWIEKDFSTFDRKYARHAEEIPAFFFSSAFDNYHEYGHRTIAAFLNIRNPVKNPHLPQLGRYDNAGLDAMNDLIEQGYDGVINDWEERGVPYEIAAFYPNQIKSATRNNGEYSPDNNEFYKQSANTGRAENDNSVRAVDDFLTPEAKAQVDSLRAKYQGTPKWLKAPNGQKSNLNELQWLLVRTPNFKNWFGDWENDPSNASKVLDPNGEPLIVVHLTYHGGFSVFDTNGTFSDKGNQTKGTGAWFADIKEEELQYVDCKTSIEGQNIYHVFLNIRNPYIYDAEGREWNDIGKIGIANENGGEPTYYDKDGNPSPYSTTDNLVRAVRNGRLGNGNHDGVIIKNVFDIIFFRPNDDYVIFKPIQIKSSERNNGEYSSRLDIYKQSANTDKAENDNFVRSVDDFLTPEAKAQVNAIRTKYQDTAQWLKAPNGQKSNLNELQWLLVRTPNFKNWFGDWENEPYEASRAVDENGEPRIVYHGSLSEPFSVFDTDGGSSLGSFFTSELYDAEGYAGHGKGYVYPVFLNIRTPYIFDDAYGRTWNNLDTFVIRDYENDDYISTDDYGNNFASREEAEDYIADTLNDPDFANYSVETKYGYNTTDEIVQAAFNGEIDSSPEGYYDSVIFDGIIDGHSNRPSTVYVVKYSEDIKSATRNNGEYSSSPEIYKQPRTFDNTMSENVYRNLRKKDKQHISIRSKWRNIWKSIKDSSRPFRDDFPLLTGDDAKAKGLTPAREYLRIMNRNISAKAHIVAANLHKHLHDLSGEQLDIFSRLLFLSDIRSFANSNKSHTLPLGYTPDTLNADYKKFFTLAKADAKVAAAVSSIYSDTKKVRQTLANLALKHGLKSFAERLNSDDLMFIQYARLLDGDDFNSNYVQAVGELQISMLQDIERLIMLGKLKAQNFDKKSQLVQQFGTQWRAHIPKGYTLFNPLGRQFIFNAHSLSEKVIAQAIDNTCDILGISDELKAALLNKISKPSGTQLMVLPYEIAKTLEKLSTPTQHGFFGKAINKISSGWKQYTLYFFTRAFKFNVRNLTGDLDALMAGSPSALKYSAQSLRDLTAAYYGDGLNISKELREFQLRGGALTIQSAQEIGDYKELKAFNDLISELETKGSPAWKKLPRQALNMLDKFLWSGIQKFSDFREQWFRYAAYLDYLHQMQENNGIPYNWGASNKDEVLAIDDIRDRAFKMSNELLGAYDQVSEMGKKMRSFLLPFYSFIEVNAKRYAQLLKNGISEDIAGDFASKYLKGMMAHIPYFTYKFVKTLFFIHLFGLLVRLWNWLWAGDAESNLPPYIQENPHMTFGQDKDGNVYYFNNIGSLPDVLEWFGFNSSTALYNDVVQILNGKMTLTDFAKQTAAAPLNKFVNALTPLIKTPLELATGYQSYPDITRPRPIKDKLQYIAQPNGGSWPYKWATGQEIDYGHDVKNMFVYTRKTEKQNTPEQDTTRRIAYFRIKDLVREFNETVYGEKPFTGGGNERTPVLRKLKAAIRANNAEEVIRCLDEFYSMGGTEKSLNSSLRSLEPLSGLNAKKKREFRNWLPKDETALLDNAETYYKGLRDFYRKTTKGYKHAQKERQAQKARQENFKN